jgi:hypothetical protein
MSINGRRMPRPPLARVTTLALLVPCDFCWAAPAISCTDAGQHYARFLCIYRSGILDAPGLATASKAAPYISAGAIVPHAQMPRSSHPNNGSDHSCQPQSLSHRTSVRRSHKP